VISALALLSVATQGSPPLQAAQNARVSRGATMRQQIVGKVPVRGVLQVCRCPSSTVASSFHQTNEPTRWCAHSWAGSDLPERPAWLSAEVWESTDRCWVRCWSPCSWWASN
jgi:hypothetical protein